jgi:hypothetical protein
MARGATALVSADRAYASVRGLPFVALDGFDVAALD